MTKAPCKNCTDRALGCHGKCESYYNWHLLHLEEVKKEKNSMPRRINKYDFTGTSPKPGKHRRTKGSRH